jgi:cytochrome c-type biogenesis protein CcmH/NrfG
MSNDPQQDHTALLSEALSFHQKGELGQTLRLYRRILEQQPDDLDALMMSATAEIQEKNYREALILLDRIIANIRTASDAYNNRSVTLK